MPVFQTLDKQTGNLQGAREAVLAYANAVAQQHNQYQAEAAPAADAQAAVPAPPEAKLNQVIAGYREGQPNFAFMHTNTEYPFSLKKGDDPAFNVFNDDFEARFQCVEDYYQYKKVLLLRVINNFDNHADHADYFNALDISPEIFHRIKAQLPQNDQKKHAFNQTLEQTMEQLQEHRFKGTAQRFMQQTTYIDDADAPTSLNDLWATLCQNEADAAALNTYNWRSACIGNYHKARQNPLYQAMLRKTGQKLIVEANHSDARWGVKAEENVPGLNQCGCAVMVAREFLRQNLNPRDIVANIPDAPTNAVPLPHIRINNAPVAQAEAPQAEAANPAAGNEARADLAAEAGLEVEALKLYFQTQREVTSDNPNESFPSYQLPLIVQPAAAAGAQAAQVQTVSVQILEHDDKACLSIDTHNLADEAAKINAYATAALHYLCAIHQNEQLKEKPAQQSGVQVFKKDQENDANFELKCAAMAYAAAEYNRRSGAPKIVVTYCPNQQVSRSRPARELSDAEKQPLSQRLKQHLEQNLAKPGNNPPAGPAPQVPVPQAAAAAPPPQQPPVRRRSSAP